MTANQSTNRVALRLAPLGMAALLLLPSCRAGGERGASVEELLEAQSYSEAFKVAAARVDASPDDAVALRDLERARVAYWLDEGRRMALGGETEQALEVFLALREQGAAPETVASWVTKCKRMISEERRLAGWARELEGELDDAAELYREAVAMWPEDEFARAGLERIEMLAQWRREQGRDYYNSGIRDLRFLRMSEARRSFEAAKKFAPSDDETARRILDVRRMQSEERVRLAEQHEQAELYHAAANEYRQAKLLFPDLPNIDERIAAADREVGVSQNLGEAERMIRRGETDAAIELLQAQLALTKFQANTVSTAVEAAREQRLDERYEKGLELERDFEFAQAIAAYDEVMAAAGGFYKDSKARAKTLATYIELAGDLYREYESAQSDAKRLSALRKIELFWPTYRDVSERVVELTAAAAVEG